MGPASGEPDEVRAAGEVEEVRAVGEADDGQSSKEADDGRAVGKAEEDRAAIYWTARTIAVLMTIWRHFGRRRGKFGFRRLFERDFDRGRGQLRFQRRFGASSIGGEDNCGFDNDSAQF